MAGWLRDVEDAGNNRSRSPREHVAPHVAGIRRAVGRSRRSFFDPGGRVCVCVINSLSCLNEKKWRKTWKKIKNENIERKMLRRKNQLSVDENI